MAHIRETGVVQPKEFNFLGKGKAFDIELGWGIVSLRNPRSDYKFARGERILANCKDDGKKVPIVVLSNDETPIRDIEVPILMLDGCATSQEAVKMLRTYGDTYAHTTKDTSQQVITFCHQKTFDALTRAQQKEITTKPLSELIRKREYRHIFFPTMLGWIDHKFGGQATEAWNEFLVAHKLITQTEARQMRKMTYEGVSIFDIFDTPDALRQMLFYRGQADEIGQAIYNGLVLAKFPPKK